MERRAPGRGAEIVARTTGGVQAISRDRILPEERRVLCLPPDAVEIDKIGAARTLHHIGELVRVLAANSLRVENADENSGALVGLDQVGIVGTRVVHQHEIRPQGRDVESLLVHGDERSPHPA